MFTIPQLLGLLLGLPPTKSCLPTVGIREAIAILTSPSEKPKRKLRKKTYSKNPLEQ